MSRRPFILFLGSGPSSLHVMAEGFARRYGEQAVDIVSACLRPSESHPIAERVMAEHGIDLTSLHAKTPVDIEVFSFDMVVTLGDFDVSCRPNLPGMPPHYHWELELPIEQADPEELLRCYREVAENLRRKVELIFTSDMLRGLSVARQNLELVLDNLAHAVMAHTVNRRIFHFNHAAEKITGYRRDEILGRDCHEVFKPRRFCGGDCLFCHEERSVGPVVPNARNTQVLFTRKNGAERMLDMTVSPLTDAGGTHVGALVSFQDVTELQVLKQRVMHHQSLGGMVGADPSMLSLFDQIREVASVNVPVMIQGESGTGKELIANAIHEESARAREPFVPINCGALPEGILESELFGHVRGAFTGAIQDKRGRFELADGGTLFLDEVAELSPQMQVKLLRVLQEQCFERVGGERCIHVDVRLISATNQDLRKLMERGRFRRDLFYRLCVIPIVPPALRHRSRDIPILCQYFLEQVAKESGRPLRGASGEVLEALSRYRWPGNVRELRNVIEYANVKCRDGTITVEHLPYEITNVVDVPAHSSPSRPGPKPKLTMDAVYDALNQSSGNKSLAAKLLGVGRTTLYRFLSESQRA